MIYSFFFTAPKLQYCYQKAKENKRNGYIIGKRQALKVSFTKIYRQLWGQNQRYAQALIKVSIDFSGFNGLGFIYHGISPVRQLTYFGLFLTQEKTTLELNVLSTLIRPQAVLQ